MWLLDCFDVTAVIVLIIQLLFVQTAWRNLFLYLIQCCQHCFFRLYLVLFLSYQNTYDFKPVGYLNCRGDGGGGRASPSRLSVPPSRFRRPPIEIWALVYERKNHLFLVGKNPKIFHFGQKKPLDFGEDLFFLFFIWRSPNFHWKIASIQFKNNENVGQVRLWINGSTFQKSPYFEKSWLRACSSLRFRQRWKSVPPCKILQFKYCFKLNYDWLVFFDTQQVELWTMPDVKIIQFLTQKTVFF